MKTHDVLLDHAQQLAQTVGYNAFSFRHLAKRMRIKTASVHYHFPTKADLGREMMARYREQFIGRLVKIDAAVKEPRRKLEAFAALFQRALAADRLCLCGTLATEFATLPRVVQREVRRTFEESEAWLARVLDEGRRAKALSFAGPAARTARTLFSALEGAMIAARTFGDPRRLAEAARWMVDAVAVDR